MGMYIFTANILFRLLMQYSLVHVRPVTGKHQHELTNNRDSRPRRNGERCLTPARSRDEMHESTASYSVQFWRPSVNYERWNVMSSQRSHLLLDAATGRGARAMVYASIPFRPPIKTSGTHNPSGAGWSALAIYAKPETF